MKVPHTQEIKNKKNENKKKWNAKVKRGRKVR